MPTGIFKNRADFFWLAAVAAAFCVFIGGSGSLASWDEAIYAQISKEMVRSGDWLHPRLLGLDSYSKPPLSLWGTAVFYFLFGVNEISARLMSGLAAAGCVTLVYALGRRLWSARAGIFSALILLSTTYFLYYARSGNVDGLNLFFITLAAYGWVLAADPKGAGYILFWAAAGGAFMTKGPAIGVVALGFFIHGLIDKRRFYARAAFWKGAALFLVIVLPWHLEALKHNPRLFWQDYVGFHWFSRALAGVDRHSGGWGYYFGVLGGHFRPWWPLLVLSAMEAVRRVFLKNQADAWRLVVSWAAMVFLFITFAVRTKLAWYLLPAYPAFALMIGGTLDARTPRRFDAFFIALAAALLVMHIGLSSAWRADYNADFKVWGTEARHNLSADDKVLLYGINEAPAAVFYFERPVLTAAAPDELERCARQERLGAVILPTSSEGSLAPLLRRLHFQKASQSETFSLWRGDGSPVVSNTNDRRNQTSSFIHLGVK